MPVEWKPREEEIQEVHDEMADIAFERERQIRIEIDNQKRVSKQRIKWRDQMPG